LSGVFVIISSPHDAIVRQRGEKLLQWLYFYLWTLARMLSPAGLLKLSKLFNLITDQILNYENIIPEEVTLEDNPILRSFI